MHRKCAKFVRSLLVIYCLEILKGSGEKYIFTKHFATTYKRKAIICCPMCHVPMNVICKKYFINNIFVGKTHSRIVRTGISYF
jgi:hypothetical protein